MKAELVPIDSISLDPANLRRHPERNLSSIVASLKRFGQQRPILVDAAGIVRAGNGTLMAAKQLGYKEIEIVRSGLEGSEATAYAIADNRTAELAEWDDNALAETLSALQIEDEELFEATGFDAKELDAMVLRDVEEDEVPEPPADPITKPGDLWILGEHRVLCGDSTKADDVARLMNGEKADLWLTDPPYNIEYDGGSKIRDVIENDSMSNDDFREWLRVVFTIAFDAIKPGASFYIWHAAMEGCNFRGAIIDSKQKTRQLLIWVKNNSTFGRQDYHWQHEPCLYGWKAGAAHEWYGDRKQTTILSFDRPSRSEEHPTMKPVALFAYQVGNSTAPQGLIYDPFLGSGTTLIAAEQLGRKCYGMEIAPAYCDVIVKRWETLTGKKARLG
jgi:site-specific DNA-methyltransferase (adenine-specific)